MVCVSFRLIFLVAVMQNPLYTHLDFFISSGELKPLSQRVVDSLKAISSL